MTQVIGTYSYQLFRTYLKRGSVINVSKKKYKNIYLRTALSLLWPESELVDVLATSIRILSLP